jgi:hypothetical protein
MKREGEKTAAEWAETDVLSQGLVEQANVQAQAAHEDVTEIASAYRDLKTGACATNPGLCAEHPTGKEEKMFKKEDTYGDTMRRWSTAVRNYRVEDLTHQVQDFARHHPALLLGGALLAGFAVTRAIKITGNGSKLAESGREQHYGQDILPAEEEVFRG